VGRAADGLRPQAKGRPGRRGDAHRPIRRQTQSNSHDRIPTSAWRPASVYSRVAQNAQGVVKGVIKGVTRASFGRRAPLTPQLKRASARRREEKDFRGVYKMQQVAAVHLGWGQAPRLETENDIRVRSMGAT